MKLITLLFIAATMVALSACGQNSPRENTSVPGAAPVTSKSPGPLPEKGFKAQITVLNPPAKLRPGQQETIIVHVKNVSDVIWWLRGGETNENPGNKFYIAVGNRWLDKGGKQTSEMEGHNALPKDLRPGEETDVSLLITAPKQPGEYILEVDMLQEQISWFGDKGSPTAKISVTVLK